MNHHRKPRKLTHAQRLAWRSGIPPPETEKKPSGAVWLLVGLLILGLAAFASV